MERAARRGFAIGFVVVALAVAAYGWRAGWLPGAGGERAARTEAPVVDLVPRVPGKPGATPGEGAEPGPGASAGAPTPAAPGSPPGAEAPKPAAPGIAALSPGAPGTQKAEPHPADKGAFDIVRVEPSGEIVVAGRCPAGCSVELTANGRTQDRATADAAGNFAMVPPKLPPGDHQLGLRITMPDGRSAVSEQSVTVSVPAAPSKDVVVVLNDPNAPSKILQQPGQAPAAAPPAGGAQAAFGKPGEARTPAQTVASLSLGAVDAEQGRFFVQGTAPNGARLRVYLNNALIAEPVAGADQRWSVRVERGLAPGRYVARVDHVEGPSGKVLSRAEARFDYEAEAEIASVAPRAPARRAEPQAATTAAPARMAATPSLQPARPDAGAPPQGAADSAPAAGEPSDAANPVVASIDTARVRRGDSLWRISRTIYGHGRRYTVIFSANGEQIRNPNLIYPGQVLVLPGDAAAAATR